MKKLVLILALFVMGVSCNKDEDCYCEKKVYEVIEADGVYKFEIYKVEVIDCVDEVVYWDEDNNFVMINCN